VGSNGGRPPQLRRGQRALHPDGLDPGATVSPNPDIIASATVGVPVARSYTITNLFGPFTGRAVGTGLGSAFRAVPTIANHAQQVYYVTVCSRARLRYAPPSVEHPIRAADLDLFVYNCTTGTCVLAGQSADGDQKVGHPQQSGSRPMAGTCGWIFRPSWTTTYNYVDVFANPAFGSVSVTDANALRPAGASWTVPGASLRTPHRKPAGFCSECAVRTAPNVLVGSGDVVIESVTP